jgi:hypothetical protein
MVKDWQGNGELLHDGENGLIAINFFVIGVAMVNSSTIFNFFAIEPIP